MISTLHGNLPLTVYPAADLLVNMRGRAEICTVRGSALGHRVNVSVSLDANTGEFLLFSPDGFTGSFRLGDLIAAQLAQQLARAAHERETVHAAQTH